MKDLVETGEFGRKNENRGKFQICEKIFSEEVKPGKFSTESEKFFGNRGENLKQGEMHHSLRGNGRLCSRLLAVFNSESEVTNSKAIRFEMPLFQNSQKCGSGIAL